MQELISKIDELESKLGNLLERYEANARGDESASEQTKALKQSLKQVQVENAHLKETLEQVRGRIGRLLEKIESRSADAEPTSSLF